MKFFSKYIEIFLYSIYNVSLKLIKQKYIFTHDFPLLGFIKDFDIKKATVF